MHTLTVLIYLKSNFIHFGRLKSPNNPYFSKRTHFKWFSQNLQLPLKLYEELDSPKLSFVSHIFRIQSSSLYKNSKKKTSENLRGRYKKNFRRRGYVIQYQFTESSGTQQPAGQQQANVRGWPLATSSLPIISCKLNTRILWLLKKNQAKHLDPKDSGV